MPKGWPAAGRAVAGRLPAAGRLVAGRSAVLVPASSRPASGRPAAGSRETKIVYYVLSWLYHGFIMAVSWLYQGFIMAVSWFYHGFIMPRGSKVWTICMHLGMHALRASDHAICGLTMIFACISDSLFSD